MGGSQARRRRTRCPVCRRLFRWTYKEKAGKACGRCRAARQRAAREEAAAERALDLPGERPSRRPAATPSGSGGLAQELPGRVRGETEGGS